MRTPEQIMEAIADATPEEMAYLHSLVKAADMPEKRKEDLHKLFMLLGMVGEMGKPKPIGN